MTIIAYLRYMPFLDRGALMSIASTLAQFGVGKGIIKKLKNLIKGLAKQAVRGFKEWFNSAFDISNYVKLNDPNNLEAAREAWQHSFELAITIFPIFIILGMLSMPFADRQKTRLWRQGLRIVGVIGLIAVSRPMVGFGVQFSNALTKAFMPQPSEILSILGPSAIFTAILGAAALTGFAVIAIGVVGAALIVAMLFIIVLLLEFRQFFINLVYIASPILATFWYIDWGLLEGVNEFASKWGRMGLFTVLSGPIIGIIFRTGVVTTKQSTAVAGSSLSEFLDALIMPAIIPLILLAATWKMVSWAGQPIGAGQAMTGAVMGAAAVAGVGMDKVTGGEGGMGDATSAASGATGGSGEAVGSGSGSGTVGGGGGQATSPSSGAQSGSRGTSTESDLATELEDAGGGATVEASNASGNEPVKAPTQIGTSSASAEMENETTAGSDTASSPATGAGQGGPSDTVTGNKQAAGDSEAQGYVSAGKDRISDSKERMSNALDSAKSQYGSKAKQKLNPTNAVRQRANNMRASADAVDEQLEDFKGAVDQESGTVDLEQAHESGALTSKPKVAEDGEWGPQEVEMDEGGTFEYEDADGNEVSQNVGSTQQRLRKQREGKLEEASQLENKADRVDSKMSEVAERTNQTRKNLGSSASEAAKKGGKEALRGTIGSHSPYLQTNKPGSSGNVPRGGGGGGQHQSSRGRATHRQQGGEQSSGRPQANVSAQQVDEHSETLAESNERFDFSNGPNSNGVFRPDSNPTPDGVSQHGYVDDPETGDTLGRVEVQESSDVTLETGEEVSLGNAKASTRDGSNPRSLSEEDGEYTVVQADEKTRKFEENEIRSDNIVGNRDARGETAKLQDHTLRNDTKDDTLFKAQAPNGEVTPVRAANEETAEALQEHEGENVDLAGEVESSYGKNDAHTGYEGAHEYNEVAINLSEDDDEGDNGGGSTESDSDTTSGDGQAGEPTTSNQEQKEGESAEYEDDEQVLEGDEGNEQQRWEWGSNWGLPEDEELELDQGTVEPSEEHYIQPSDGLGDVNGGAVETVANGEDGFTAEIEGYESNSSGESVGASQASSGSGSAKHMIESSDGVGDQRVQGQSSEDTDTAHESVSASELTTEFMWSEEAEEGVTIDVELPEKARYAYHSDSERADEMKSKGVFVLQNPEEVDEDTPRKIGEVAFAGEEDYPDDGDWGFENAHGKPVVTGNELSNVKARSWGAGWAKEHGSAEEMAREHGGEPEKYMQVRPTDETEIEWELKEEELEENGGSEDSQVSNDARGAIEPTSGVSSEVETNSQADKEGSPPNRQSSDDNSEHGPDSIETSESDSSEVLKNDTEEIEDPSEKEPNSGTSRDVVVDADDEGRNSVGAEDRLRDSGEYSKEGRENSVEDAATVEHTDAESNENLSEDDDSFEERAANWRENRIEGGGGEIEEGEAAEAMQHETLETGEDVFVTDYDELDEVLDSEFVNSDRAEELKHRSLAGHEWTAAMDENVPEIVFNEEENETVQLEAGGAETETWSVEEAPVEVLEEVDREEFERSMAVQLLGGNVDPHPSNVHITEDGSVEVIDFDRTASSSAEFDDYEDAEMSAYAAAHTAADIGEVNDEFESDWQAHEESISEKAVEVANEIDEEEDVDELLEPVQEVDEAHDETEVAPVIKNNIETLIGLDEDETESTDDESIDSVVDELSSSSTNESPETE